MTWANRIREWRIVSILSLVFISFILWDFLQWIQNSPAQGLGDGIAITGIMTSLAAIYKFIFDFAMTGSKNPL